MIPADLPEMSRRGMSISELAAHYGVSDRTITRWRRAIGLSSSWTPPPRKHGIDHYRDGCRCPECVEAMRARSRAAYRAYAEAAGTPTRRGRWTPADDAELLHGPGTVAERATRLGRSYGAAVQRITRLHRPGQAPSTGSS